MANAIPVPIRREIIERHQHGETIAEIADALSLSFWGVRQMWRQYRKFGDAGLALQYENSVRDGPRCARVIYRSALWLKRHQRSWGAGLIRVILQQRHPDISIPHPRTFQRWFRAHQLNPVRVQRPSVVRKRATQVHQVWQDATSHVRLADGSSASWISLIDEYSGALLQSEAFPHYIFEAIPAQQGQQALRSVFSTWGKPHALRVDNGPPWEDKQALPSPLTLWLSGLEIAVIHNRPYCPQDNGKVERAHGVVKG